MNGFDFLNELLRKRHDVDALGRAIHAAGLISLDISKWTDEQANRVAECYLVTAEFPPTSLRAIGVQDD